MNVQRIHARAVAGLAAFGLLALAATPAWAHKNDTTTSITSLSPNPATQGDVVTIEATVTFDGTRSGGAGNHPGGDPVPSSGAPVIGNNVNFTLSSGDCATVSPAFSGTIGFATTNGSGVASFGLDTSFFTAGDYCVGAVHNAQGGNHGDGQSEDEADLEILAGAAEVDPLEVVKTLISGPLTTSDDGAPAPTGCNIDHYDGTDADCDGFATDFITGPNDAGPVGVKLVHRQHYVFEIEITNNGAEGEFDGTVLADTLGADWDLDPVAEEDFEADGDLDGDCTGTDGDCDGDEASHDGVILVSGDCAYTLSQPDSADKPDPPVKQPEFLDILLGELDEGDMCTFLVFVNTVENPASVKDTGEGDGSDPDEKFEPTDCRELEYPTDPDENPIFDTFALNDGIKAFDGTDGDETATFRRFGPVASLQLTCNFPDEE